MFFRKKRWLCKEVEDMLLALHPVYYICVKVKVNETFAYFSFRDENGNMIVDPYEKGVVGLIVDYMRNGCTTKMDSTVGAYRIFGKLSTSMWRSSPRPTGIRA